jgi:hypothetical protein
VGIGSLALLIAVGLVAVALLGWFLIVSAGTIGRFLFAVLVVVVASAAWRETRGRD